MASGGPKRGRKSRVSRLPARERIIRAALSEFSAKGFKGTTTREIARRARVNQGLIYHYFHGKRHLYLTLLEEFFTAIRGLMSSAGLSRPRTAARRERFVSQYVTFTMTHLDYIKLALMEIFRAGDEIHTIARFAAPMLTDLFSDPPRARRVASLDRRVLETIEFLVTFGGANILYFLLAPLLGEIFGVDPLSPAALLRRRKRLERMVEGLC